MTLKLIDMYGYADSREIGVYYLQMSDTVSISCPLGYIVMDVDRLSNSTEELVCLTHEIGHYETGSFYNIHTPYDIRRKHEVRADRWAIKKLVPKDELAEAIECGITEPWELADYFEVTEEFVKKACEYYKLLASA